MGGCNIFEKCLLYSNVVLDPIYFNCMGINSQNICCCVPHNKTGLEQHGVSKRWHNTFFVNYAFNTLPLAFWLFFLIYHIHLWNLWSLEYWILIFIEKSKSFVQITLDISMLAIATYQHYFNVSCITRCSRSFILSYTSQTLNYR